MLSYPYPSFYVKAIAYYETLCSHQELVHQINYVIICVLNTVHI